MSYSAQIYFKKHIATAQDAFLFIDKVKTHLLKQSLLNLKNGF